MRFFRHLFHTLAAPVLLMPCATARAAGSLGDMSDSVRGEIAKFGPALKAGFALAGFFLVGLGLWQLYSLSQQPGRPKGGALIAMCIEGQEMSSVALSQKMQQLAARGASQLTFLIGSSFGLDEDLKKKADLRLSMSPMTFPHHLARVMLLEQIYRAYQIEAGTKYHK